MADGRTSHFAAEAVNTEVERFRALVDLSLEGSILATEGRVVLARHDRYRAALEAIRRRCEDRLAEYGSLDAGALESLVVEALDD